MPEPIARESGADAYLDTLDRMEPEVACVDLGAAGASVSISLKRVADAVERLVTAAERTAAAMEKFVALALAADADGDE